MANIKWFVNEIEMSGMGIYIARGYSISSATVSRSIYPSGCAAYVATKAQIGLKTITIPIRVKKETTEDAEMTRSWFLSNCLSGKLDLCLTDGRRYVAALIDSGDVEKIAEGVIRFTIKLAGYQRGGLVRVPTPNVFCASTAPETPFKITATATRAGDFKVAGITFGNCHVNDIITIDGTAGKIVKNGIAVNIAETDMITFPFLNAGQNNIQCDTVGTVEFFPIFM